ncbi:hypothetical protein KTC70_27880 [Klebsiella pneumoniae]|nr:hypothetical protein [Klebsiella pneumoniae]
MDTLSVNPDMRGIAHSEGNTTMIGSQEAEDGYDLIEWLAKQSWSNGKTALTGTILFSLFPVVYCS